MNKVYEIITEQIIAQLEKGIIPWKRAYLGGMPKNGISKKEYNGINIFLLSVRGYANPFWFTFKQVQELGGYIKKGEKGTPIIFWKIYTPAAVRDDPNRQPGEISSSDLDEHRVLRYYYVFNFEQTEGLSAEKFTIKAGTFSPISCAEQIVQNYHGAPTMQHKEQRAWYSPVTDIVNMPIPESFNAPEFYYKTLFHELIHSTGHDRRLNRSLKGNTGFASVSYSKEELIAEMGASFLSGRAGIFQEEQLEQASAYIQAWLKELRNDKMLVVKAASQAQKAADYIAAA